MGEPFSGVGSVGGLTPPRVQTPQEQRLATLSTEDRQRLQQAAADFEALFMRQMFAAMRKTIPTGGVVPNGEGERLFRDLLDGEYAKIGSAGNNGIGLKEALLRQMVGVPVMEPAGSGEPAAEEGSIPTPAPAVEPAAVQRTLHRIQADEAAERVDGGRTPLPSAGPG